MPPQFRFDDRLPGGRPVGLPTGSSGSAGSGSAGGSLSGTLSNFFEPELERLRNRQPKLEQRFLDRLEGGTDLGNRFLDEGFEQASGPVGDNRFLDAMEGIAGQDPQAGGRFLDQAAELGGQAPGTNRFLEGSLGALSDLLGGGISDMVSGGGGTGGGNVGGNEILEMFKNRAAGETDLGRIREEVDVVAEGAADQISEELFRTGGQVDQATQKALRSSVQSGFGPGGGFDRARQNILDRASQRLSKETGARIAQAAPQLAQTAVQDEVSRVQSLGRTGADVAQAQATASAASSQANARRQAAALEAALGGAQALGRIGTNLRGQDVESVLGRQQTAAELGQALRGQDVQRLQNQLNTFGEVGTTISGQGVQQASNLLQTGQNMSGLQLEDELQRINALGGFTQNQAQLANDLAQSMFGGRASIEQLELARERQDQNQQIIDARLEEMGGGIGDAAGGALSGAGTGAAIGSVVPGLGTAVGAVGGGILGGLGGLF